MTAIVQKASTQWDVVPVAISLPAPATAGNLLIAVAAARNASPNVAAAGFTSYGQVSSFAGRGFLQIGYRVAIAGDQTFSFPTQYTEVTIYEISGAAALPGGYQLRSATLQGASGTKALAAFTAPGTLQVAGFIWDNHSVDQTPGAGYTQDAQMQTNCFNCQPGFLSEHSSTGATAQITGPAWAWGAMAIGIPDAAGPRFAGEPGGGRW